MSAGPTLRSAPWTASERGVLIALLVGLLIYLIVRRVLNPIHVADPQPALPARAAELQDKIDPNTADEATLAALPAIGPKRAADIVAFRQRVLADNPGSLAFAGPNDLLRIKGIGLNLLAQIEPHLIFPGPTRSTTQPIPPGSAGG